MSHDAVWKRQVPCVHNTSFNEGHSWQQLSFVTQRRLLFRVNLGHSSLPYTGICVTVDLCGKFPPGTSMYTRERARARTHTHTHTHTGRPKMWDVLKPTCISLNVSISSIYLSIYLYIIYIYQKSDSNHLTQTAQLSPCLSQVHAERLYDSDWTTSLKKVGQELVDSLSTPEYREMIVTCNKVDELSTAHPFQATPRVVQPRPAGTVPAKRENRGHQ